MRKAVFGFLSFVFAVACAAAFCVVVGCEQGTAQSLTIDPSATTLEGTTNTVTLTVATNSLRTLSFPLKWRVSNPALGAIIAAEGARAQYTRSALPGINIITAADQYGAEGFATVTQE